MSIEEATIGASKAGNNLLMFSHNFPRTEQIFDAVLRRAEEDKELQLIVEQNSRTIIEFKRKTVNPTAAPQLSRVVSMTSDSTASLK